MEATGEQIRKYREVREKKRADASSDADQAAAAAASTMLYAVSKRDRCIQLVALYQFAGNELRCRTLQNKHTYKRCVQLS